MAEADGEPIDLNGVDKDYSSGLDNEFTHWDTPVRFLPVELHVLAGQRLQLVCEHNLHDLSHVHVSGVREEMIGIGHRELVDKRDLKLGVTVSTARMTV